MIITGNPKKGLASALYKLYPDATFISRESGYDLSKKVDQERCAKLIKDHDIFINCSAIWKFNQTILLDIVYKEAQELNQPFHIVCVGSTTDRASNGKIWLYNAEKKALRDYCNTLGMNGVWNQGPKVSYISLGTLDNNQHKHPDRRCMTLDNAAEYIKWVIDQPKHLVINEISIDPLQQPTPPKHYCPIPFHHLAIRPNGNVQPCCFFKHDEIPQDFNLGHPSLFHHPFLQKIRSDLRNDQPVAGCEKCYEAEKLTGKSMRTEYLDSFDLGFSRYAPEEPKLTYIDLALSNVCNNKCRMCGPELSTSWYSDAKKLNIPIQSGVIKHEYNVENFDLQSLTFIKMIGGEPLMEQEKFINVLKKCKLSNLSILITTNATVLPNDELLGLIKQCKSVKWMLSIDAYGPLNDVLRKGSEWETVVNNLQWFEKSFPGDVSVHSVASIYNINCLDLLSDYIKHNLPSVNHKYVMIDGVDWMHPSNLPNDVKPKVTSKLLSTQIPNVNLIIKELNKEGDYKLFLKEDQKLNELRNESWDKFNQELYNWLKESNE